DATTLNMQRTTNIAVKYSIGPLGGQHKGRLGLYLFAEQSGPVYAEFIDMVFYIPIVFARDTELQVENKINIAGKEFFKLHKSHDVDDDTLESLRTSSSNLNKSPVSYAMNWTWVLPADISNTELEEAKYIKWSLLACVEPIRLNGEIEKASH